MPLDMFCCQNKTPKTKEKKKKKKKKKKKNNKKTETKKTNKSFEYSLYLNGHKNQGEEKKKKSPNNLNIPVSST